MDFSDELSRNSYAPGGGSVAALVGLLGSSLSCMDSNLTFENKKFSIHKEKHFKASFDLQKLSNELSLLIDQDTNAYNKIIPRNLYSNFFFYPFDIYIILH